MVLLEGDGAQLHLGEERFVERLQSYLEVATALRERVPDIDYVDLRFDDRVYVKPRDGAGTVEAGKPCLAQRTEGEPWHARERYLVGPGCRHHPRSPPSSAR